MWLIAVSGIEGGEAQGWERKGRRGAAAWRDGLPMPAGQTPLTM